ncbi:MAG: dihydrodipicolinate synthase family protein [Actinomycetota bacterium]|nr:MAG: dihydrodipicolinate synthase family protein [Actinomycetota bacterium]
MSGPEKLRGVIAAAVTPLAEDGARVDLEAVGPLAAFLAAGGVDGVLTCGTTGEGVLLSVAERRAVTEAFLAARPGGFLVAVHAGAQTTADTVALARHAAEAGADAVAVIAPPYFPLDAAELLAHFAAAAEACAPLPFYVYEFAGRSGYAIPVEVVERLRERAPNLAGMKISDTPFAAVRPYLLDGLDVFIGSEPLVLEGMEHGAVGAVSGLATAWPEVVAALVRDWDPMAHARVVDLRERLAALPFHAALKAVLAARGVPIRPDVRPPLRGLTPAERELALAL